MIRYVSWAINWLGSDYSVIRYDNGKVHILDHCTNRDEAWDRAKLDRAIVLNSDPVPDGYDAVFETHPIETRVRL